MGAVISKKKIDPVLDEDGEVVVTDKGYNDNSNEEKKVDVDNEYSNNNGNNDDVNDNDDEEKPKSCLQRLFNLKTKENGDDDGDGNSDGNCDDDKVAKKKKNRGGILSSMFTQEYIDPPMPMIGKPIRYDMLYERSMYARKHSANIIKQILSDADESIEVAKSIPVGTNMYRVVIKPEQLEYMSKKTKQKHIDEMVLYNMNMLEKTLMYRKMGIDLLNLNYSKTMVRDIEKVQVGESRAIVIRREVDRPDVPISEFAVRRTINDEAIVIVDADKK